MLEEKKGKSDIKNLLRVRLELNNGVIYDGQLSARGI